MLVPNSWFPTRLPPDSIELAMLNVRNSTHVGPVHNTRVTFFHFDLFALSLLDTSWYIHIIYCNIIYIYTRSMNRAHGWCPLKPPQPGTYTVEDEWKEIHTVSGEHLKVDSWTAPALWTCTTLDSEQQKLLPTFAYLLHYYWLRFTISKGNCGSLTRKWPYFLYLLESCNLVSTLSCPSYLSCFII